MIEQETGPRNMNWGIVSNKVRNGDSVSNTGFVCREHEA